MSVYYQPPTPVDASPLAPITRQCAPALANLIRVLTQPFNPNPDLDGLDLSYSQAVSAIYHLHQTGHLDADLLIEESPLSEEVNRLLSEQKAMARPELSTTGSPADTPPPMGVEQAPAGSEKQSSPSDAQRVGTMTLP
jgi:hypothetical protein